MGILQLFASIDKEPTTTMCQILQKALTIEARLAVTQAVRESNAQNRVVESICLQTY